MNETTMDCASHGLDSDVHEFSSQRPWKKRAVNSKSDQLRQSSTSCESDSAAMSSSSYYDPACEHYTSSTTTPVSIDTHNFNVGERGIKGCFSGEYCQFQYSLGDSRDAITNDLRGCSHDTAAVRGGASVSSVTASFGLSSSRKIQPCDDPGASRKNRTPPSRLCLQAYSTARCIDSVGSQGSSTCCWDQTTTHPASGHGTDIVSSSTTTIIVDGETFSTPSLYMPLEYYHSDAMLSSRKDDDIYCSKLPPTSDFYVYTEGESQPRLYPVGMMSSWYRQLGLDNPEVSRLATHVWNRASRSAQCLGCKVSELFYKTKGKSKASRVSDSDVDSIVAVLAACFWMSYKLLSNRFPAKLSADSFKARLGLPPNTALGATELEILKHLDWRPLQGFLESL